MRVLIGLCLLCAVLSLAFAQSALPTRDYSGEETVRQWTQQTWTTQGDAPLRSWREQLEARYTDKDIPDSVVEQYKQAALQAPLDRRKLFQWGYSAYLLYRGDPGHTRDFQLIRTLFKTKPPVSYEFLRMFYLLEKAQGIGFYGDYLTTLGERLIEADPKDYFVWRYLSASYSLNDPNGRRKCLECAQKMLQIAPDRAVSYAAVANVYHNIWIVSGAKDNEAARQAVQYYREFIKRETRPFMAANKKMAQDIIEKLNRYIAQADNKGKSG